MIDQVYYMHRKGGILINSMHIALHQIIIKKIISVVSLLVNSIQKIHPWP